MKLLFLSHWQKVLNKLRKPGPMSPEDLKSHETNSKPTVKREIIQRYQFQWAAHIYWQNTVCLVVHSGYQ